MVNRPTLGIGEKLLLALLAVAVGFLGALAIVVLGPVLLAAGMIAGVTTLAILLKGYKVFWAYLTFLLFGYLFLGKGFAYVGVPPIYVAELGLLLAGACAVAVLLVNRLMDLSVVLRPEVLLLAAFVSWQLLCTVPYVDTYGMDALRDAALWGYAAFGLFVLLLVPRDAVGRFFGLYGKVLPYLLVWLLVAWVLTEVATVELFTFPGSPVPLLSLKAGDVGVHLGGAAAFMLLRLDLKHIGWSNAKLWCLWSIWVLDWIVWGVSNRGGMLSAVVGIGIVMLWRPRTLWYRPAILATSLVMLLFFANFSATFGQSAAPAFGRDAEISAEQITENFTSVFVEDASGTLQSTKDWRLSWWRTIYGYTFGGEYFWSGKGYGVNLATDDNFQIDLEEESVRSPHNATMTILARSGVPGLVLWLLFLLSFGWFLVGRTLGKHGVEDEGTRYAVWLLAYWMAFLFNSSFDVFLEGPMGGVWFWTLVGMSLAYFLRSSAVGTPTGTSPPSSAGKVPARVA